MNKRKGLTLVELILTISLLSVIIIAATNIITFTTRGHQATIDEYDIQSNIRIVSQKVNTVIRDSSAVFILHRDNANNLTPEWNYLMINPEKDKLINYIWNPTTNSHDISELFPSAEGVTLDLEYIKENTMDVNRLLKFNLAVEGLGEARTIETEIESKNSLQIVDRSYSREANTLAYRIDERIDEVSNSQAVVGMVLDKSGSMNRRMDGSSSINNNHNNTFYHSRIKLMKQEAVRLVEDLADYPNVYISINPFDSTANASKDMLNAEQNLETNPGLKNIINDLSANGGTNTGDGIRRAYYKIKEFNELQENTTKTNKNFMIILVDGVTTYGSIHENVTQDIIETETHHGQTYSYNGREYMFSHSEVKYIWGWSRTYYYYKRSPYTTYVLGNNSIVNSKASNNTLYSSGRYFGNGSNLDSYGTEYVERIGELVQNYKQGTNEEIKVYVIGFSNVTADYGSLEDIAMATTGDTVYYEAGSVEALEAIFSGIQKDISDALWHIGGPN